MGLVFGNHICRPAGLIELQHAVISRLPFQPLVSQALQRRPLSMSVKETIISQMQQIAREQKKQLSLLKLDLPLLETGLNSLSVAILVARLEDVLQVDPFSSADAVNMPITLADLIELYEDATK